MSILALGPMTTIATVLAAEPELKHRIARIVAMAGAVDVHGNIRVPGFTEDHPNTVAEWNIYVDPVAAKAVFDSGIPITIVPLDATNDVPLRPDFAERMRKTVQTQASTFLLAVFDSRIDSNSTGEYYHWDPLAAVVASRPLLCRMDRRKLTVRADFGGSPPPGVSVEAFPLTNAKGGIRRPFDAATAGGLTGDNATSIVEVCQHVDPAAFEDQFLSIVAPEK